MRALTVLALIMPLASCRHAPPLAGNIAPGYRAFAIPIDANESREVHPKDRIDIEVSGPATAGKNVLLFHMAYVIDVDKIDDKNIVWVAMNPNEVQYAALISDMKLNVRAITVSSNNTAPVPQPIPGGFRKLFR